MGDGTELRQRLELVRFEDGRPMSAELLKSLQEMDPQVEDSVSAEACSLGAPALPGGLASTDELRGERVSGLVRSGGTQSREVGGRSPQCGRGERACDGEHWPEVPNDVVPVSESACCCRGERSGSGSRPPRWRVGERCGEDIWRLQGRVARSFARKKIVLLLEHAEQTWRPRRGRVKSELL